MLRKLQYFSLALAICLSGAAVTTAQEDDDRRPRGGFGGGPGGPGGPGGFRMMGGGGGMGPAGLLMMEEVREELKLSEEQVEELNTLREQAMGDTPRPQDWRGLSDEERREAFGKLQEQMQKAGETMNSKLEEVLDPDQYDRLLGLYAQRSPAEALTNKTIAEKLGLNDEKVNKLKEVQEELQASMRERFRDGGRGEGGERGEGGGDFRERMAQMQKENEEKLLAVLSEEEKKKFEELKGEKFEFPERRGFGFGGAGGDRGGDRGDRGGERGGDRQRGEGRPQRDRSE